jgi:LysM repeat protein
VRTISTTGVLTLAAAFLAGALATAAVKDEPQSVRLVTRDSATTVSDQPRRQQPPGNERYVVRPGDTLWGIAAGRYEDPAAAIETIKQRNSLRRDTLYAGEVLVLPATGRTSDRSGRDES